VNFLAVIQTFKLLTTLICKCLLDKAPRDQTGTAKTDFNSNATQTDKQNIFSLCQILNTDLYDERQAH
jgi:hypothetical protein